MVVMAGTNAHHGVAPNVNALLNQLYGRKGCLKCILATVQCCQIIGIIGYLIMYSVLANATIDSDSTTISCWTIGDDDTTCYTQDEIDDAKALFILSLIVTCLLFCLVCGLYHAVTQHEAKRIDTYLVIMAIIWGISVVFQLIGSSSDGVDRGSIIWSIVVTTGIWGTFIWYCHGYADTIRKLTAVGYPVNQCRF